MALLRTVIFPLLTLTPLRPAKMAARVANSTPPDRRGLPIVLFDVMDTIVRDPFYHDVPAIFGMSMKELLQAKHPTVWIEFEEGLIDELEIVKQFFKDGMSFDLEGKCKPSTEVYKEVVRQLEAEASNCIFADDRQ